MYNLRINELTPGRKYYIKVRAKAPDLAVSEWSQVFELTTSQDTVPPHRVGNLTFISEGDAFVAKWNAPTINADATPCTDLSHYFIRLTDIDGAKTVELQSSTTAFTLDINSNKQLFGSLAGRIKIEVAAVDTVGNTGALEEAIAVNPAPAKVTGVTATAGVETVRVGWDLGTETDISHYEVHMSTSGSAFAVGPSTLRGQAAANTDNYTQTTSSLVPVYFKVVAVDKFNQKSIPSDAASAQPRLSTDYDKTPPGAVSGFTVTQVLAADNTSATARVSFTAVSGSDLDKYEIQYRKTGDTTSPWSFTNVPSDQTTAEIKPLPLSTSYDFKIRAVDFNSNKGVWSSVVVAPGVKKTTLPAAPTGVIVRGGMSNLMVTWNASTDPSMANWAGTYEVQISKASTFTSPTTIKTSSTLASFINLDQNTVYYARVRSLDPYGNTGAWSTTANGNTGIVADANASRVIWSATEPANGKTNDLWIKTPENVQYRFDGTNWIKAQDTELADEIDNVRQTADGKNKAWYQTTKPPLTSNTQGDLWFDTANGNKMYIWSTSANNWVSAQDEAIQDALDNAADAQQTADGKNTIFYTTPAAGVTLREGDTWFDNSVIKVYKNGAWVDASTALDNAKANQAIQIAGSKNKTYYVAKASATGMIEGDILFDTADGNKQYRYNGTTWVSVTDAAIAAAEEAAGQAQQTADKKNTIYYATPPAGAVLKDGDVWFDGAKIKTYRGTAWVDSSTGLTTQQAADATTIANGKNKTYYVAYASRPTTGLTAGDLLFDTADKYKSYRYNGSAWESVRDGTIADAKTAADQAKAAAELRAQTFYEATGPANTNSRLKVNDLWIRSTDNQLHRWTGSAWAEIQDDAIALTQANLTTAVGDLQTSIGNVQAIADGKINTFISNTAPTQGLDNGDIWFDTSVTPVATKVYDGTNWIVSGDKAALDAASAVQTNLNATNTALNKKNTTYAQTSAPTANLVAGDLWLNTTLVSGTPKNEMSRWDGDNWIKVQDKIIFDVQALADGKAMVFTRATKPTDAESDLGDIWFDTSTTPWGVKVRTGAATWTVSGDKDARDAAATAQTEAARKIQSFYTDTDPATITANNVKAGDLWYKIADKRARVRASNNTWVELKDSAIKTAQDAADAAQASANTAITNAGNAFNLADGKAQVFWGGTRPSNLVATDAGDIWVDTAKTPNEIQVWSGTEWTVTGDPATKTIAEAANTLAGTKAYTYFGGTKPTASSTPAPTTGDIWINTAKTPHEVQIYNGTAFVIAADQDARTAAAEKAYIFTTTNSTAPTSPTPKRGDVWIDTSTGKTKIRSTTAWVDTTDPEARNIANSKITTYYNGTAPTAPTGGFTAGDLWVKTPENRINRWSGTAWIEVKDAAITAAQAAADAAAAQAATGIANAQAAFNLADGKAQIFRRTTPPTGLGTADEGDIWVDTSKTPNETKMWTGTIWVDADAATKKIATDAATLAGTKSVTFVQPGTPTGMVKGDIWINTTAGNNYGQTKVYSGSAWVDTKDVAATDLAKSKAYIFTTTNATAPTSPTPVRGDVWINTGDGKTKIHNGTTWVDSTDPEARNIANQKTTIYYAANAPTTPKTGLAAFIEGDMWVRTTDNRVHIRTAGTWKESADTSIKAAQDAANAANAAVGNLAGTVGDLTTQVDNKVEVWFQTNQPAVPAAAADRLKMKGDIWINTSTGASNGEVKMYPGTGTVWNVVTDPAAIAAAQTAKDIADSKRQVFGGNLAPSNTTGATGNNLKVNDLWIRDSDKKMHRWGGSAWELAQDAAIAGLESKGTDLVINGTGILGNNYNFSRWVFDPSDAPAGARGSFMSSTMSSVIEADSDIPYDTSKTYKLSYSLRKGNPDVGTGHYAGFVPKDAAGKTVGPSHYMFIGNTTTTLAAALNPGDTQVVLTNSANWYGTPGKNAGNNTHMRSIIFWDYTDIFGKTWAPETYSRNFYGGDKWADGAIDPTTHTITLRAPYNGPMKPEGTVLSNGSRGSTYMYSSSGALTSDWTKYSATISGEMSGTTASGKGSASFATGVPPGTAFVKFFVIVNHNSWSQAGSITKIAGISLSDASAAYDRATTAIDSANARNRSIFSTGNATGTTLNGYAFINGDMWYKKDANNTIIGMWEFIGGAWVSKTLNNQVIANLDAGKINAGTISADRIGARSLSASKLQISDNTNLVPDDGLESAENWRLSQATIKTEGDYRYIEFNTSDSFNTVVSDIFGVQPGEYLVEFERRKTPNTTGGSRINVHLELQNFSGSRHSLASATYIASGQDWSKTSHTLVVPPGVQRAKLWLETATGSHGVDVRYMVVKRKTGTTLIENGAITTEKIVVGGLDGTVTIKDGTISADELAANSVIAGKIATGAIVAGNIQTGQINAGHIISEGIDGTVVIKDGTLTATQIKGGTITGDKIAGNTIDATSIKAGSIVIGAANSPLSSTGIATPTTVATAKSEAISTAGINADTKVATALQTAAADAQQKADAAKDAAEQAAKQYADGEIDTATAQALIDAATTAQQKADAAKDAAEQAAKGYTDGQVGPINTAVGGINTKLGGWSHPTDQTFINGGKIYTDSITAGQIAANAIGVSELAANAVTADKIAANSVSAQKLIVGTAENMVNDPTFIEAIGRNWQSAAGFSITTEGTNGGKSMKLIGSAAQQISYNLPENSVNVEAGTKIRAVVTVKSSAAIVANAIGIGLRLRSATGTLTYPGVLYIPAQTTISAYKTIDLGMIDIPTDGTLSWYIVSQTNSGTGTVWFDNVQVMRAVGTTVIADNAITTGKIVTDAVTALKIKSDAIETRHIKTDAITSSKILAGEIKAINIDTGAITAGKIAAGAITIGANAPIAPGTVAVPSDVTAAKSEAISEAGTNADGKITTALVPVNANISAVTTTANNVKTLTDGWKFTGKTTINGGQIEADTIKAAQIATGAITIGKIAPNTVAVPSDVTNAVNPINNTLDAWSTDNRTYINGGAIKTQTIDATSIKANSIVIGAANSPIANVPGSTIQAGTVPTSAINSTQLTTYIDGNTKVTAGSNAATTLSGLTALQGGVTVIDGGKIKTDSITALQIATNAITVNELAANAVVADSLTTNMILSKGLQIQSALEINAAGGHIKSSNWNDSAKTGFYMDQQQLIVHNGRIEAAAIKLQDSSNIMPPTYASFNARESAYAVNNMWTSSVSGITKFPADGKFGGDSLQAVITANTGFIGMGHSATDLNIPIEGGKQYIISFYVSNRSSKVITLQPELYQTASILIKATATSIANSTAWTRYSMVVTAPATMTRAILRFNLTVGATATFRLDGIQVEQKIGQETAPSNWSPPGFTSIDGESITTGSISSSATARTNPAIAAWSIDTLGRARFGDVTVNGKIIVGEEVSDKAGTSIQSDTYSPGIAGWAIKGSGDVEFNNGTFRGMLSLEKADLSMKASVSPIKVFSSPSQSTTIDAAHIRGVTYSYNRELKAGTEDTHYPTSPRLDRKGNFFIGPTTDRSVNIQVHDDTAEDAVYLGDPPSNVSITALNIGEQTNPASPPAVREDQGLSFRAQRIEARNYSYTGGDTAAQNVSQILSGVSSTVKLRSPLYPESDGGLDMYPESANVLQSVTDYSVPKNKNLLPSGEAVGWIFNSLMRESVQAATVQPEFGSSITAGEGRMASIEVSPFSSSNYVRVAPFSPISYTSGKRHIASFYVNSEEATSDIYFGVKSGGTVLSPTEPANASLPAAINFYSTNPPGDYWPLKSNWLNIGVSKGVSDINGTSNGTPPFVNGAVDIAASQRLRADGIKADHFINGGTVSFWFKPAINGNTGEAAIYHRGNPSSTTKEMWVILNGATNRLQGGIALTGTARTWQSTTTITYGEWHHIAIVIGASTTNRTFRVYINGVREIDTTFTNITGGFDTGQFLYLGADRSLVQLFSGQIGDVAHWEAALSAQSIAAIHASPRSAWPSDSFTGSQVAVVPPGQRAHRVSFWSDSLSGTSSPAISAIQSGIPAKFNLFAFQVEEAAYKDDVSLSAGLRESKRPTAWSVSNLEVRSAAKISVETKPVVNFLDYVESTKAVLPNQRSGLNIEPPAQITFDVGSRFSDDYAVTEGVFSGDMFTADASYKMSSKGFSYPGSPQPFMPTALDLHYDFTNLALTSRPRIGGTGYLFLALNNQDLGGVRYGGEGVVIKDNFDYPDQDPMPSPWQVVGARTARISGNRAYLVYNTTTVDGEKYVYHGHEFQSHNQTASCTVEGTQGIGWRYGYGGPMISINPIKGDRIHLVVLNNNDPIWRLVVFKNNVKTILRSGSFAGTRTGIPVIKLSRTGNTITGWYNNTQLFKETFADTELPQGGRFAGFAANVGYMDNYIASRSGADAAANGEIQPYSFNINNGRGLKVVTDYEVIDTIPYRVGEVHVLAPGYYTMSVTVRAEGLGGSQQDNFWMDVVDYRDVMGKENRTIQLSNKQNQYNGAGSGAYLTGNATAYIEGRLEFRMFTDDTSTNRINRIEITVVRVA